MSVSKPTRMRFLPAHLPRKRKCEIWRTRSTMLRGLLDVTLVMIRRSQILRSGHFKSCRAAEIGPRSKLRSWVRWKNSHLNKYRLESFRRSRQAPQKHWTTMWRTVWSRCLLTSTTRRSKQREMHARLPTSIARWLSQSLSPQLWCSE